MREKEKERGKKKRVIQRATHTTTNATSFFYERGKEKRKVPGMQLPAYVFLFFFILAGTYTLYSTLHHNYSPISFLIRDFISLSLTNGAFTLLGRVKVSR